MKSARAFPVECWGFAVRDRHWLWRFRDDARQGVHERDATAQQVGSGRCCREQYGSCHKLLTRGSKPTSPAYSPSRLIGRLRKGTASEKSPCILSELTAAAHTQRHPGTRMSATHRSRSSETHASTVISRLQAQSDLLFAAWPPATPPGLRLLPPSAMQALPCKADEQGYSSTRRAKSGKEGSEHRCGPWGARGRPWGRTRWPKPRRRREGQS